MIKIWKVSLKQVRRYKCCSTHTLSLLWANQWWFISWYKQCLGHPWQKILNFVFIHMGNSCFWLAKTLKIFNSFPHGRFWKFVYKENVRCTRLMQRSVQVVIRQMFVLCSLKIEGSVDLLTNMVATDNSCFWLADF
jgi:hypothetical protein